MSLWFVFEHLHESPAHVIDQLVARHPRTMSMFFRALGERVQKQVRGRAAVIQLAGTPPVTPEECVEITRTQDLVLRNLKITEMYHRLSSGLAGMLGPQDINWCTFACNATKTAGYTIRKEDVTMPRLALTLQAIETPSYVLVPRPISSSNTSDRAVAV